MSNRDDFSAAVKRTLADRVNWNCCKPDCGAQTRGPHTLNNKSVNIGVAAHITAAAPGGPRYNPNLTTDQRESIENAIWLCKSCSDLIDKDEVAFPVRLLEDWKDQAEARASLRIGKPRFQVETQLQQLVESNSQLVQSNTELNRRLLSVEIAPATVAHNVVEQELKRSIDIALRWSEKGSFAAGQSLVAEIREHTDFCSLSPEFQARMATIAARCAEGLGQQERAIEELELALRLTPDELRALSNCAGAAMLQNQWGRAIALAKRALELDAKDENASLVIVQAWTEEENYDAIEEFLLQSPHFLDSAHGLAVMASTRLAQGNIEEAVGLARKGVQLDGENIVALEELYDSCFRPLRKKMVREDWLHRSHSTNRRLQLAQAAIGRAGRLVENSPNRGLWQRLLINQAAVASARGRFVEALAL